MNQSDIDYVRALFSKSFELSSFLGKLECPDRAIRKVELTEGRTKIIVNTVDSEIIQSLPVEVPKPNFPCSIWHRWAVEGHIKVWVKMDQVEEALGGWMYFESSIPRRLLRYPESKSCKAFERLVLLAYGIGMAMSPTSAEALKKEAVRILDPNTEWIDPL